jgi:Protein of unknown function (DUF4239)
MFDSLFDVPLPIAGMAIIGSLCLFSVAGLALVRRFVLPRLRVHVEDSEYAGGMLQSVMVFYGLAVALMAVSVSQTYSDVSKILSSEATNLAALYRDVSGYPEPIRTRLRTELRNYTDQIVHEAFPLMAKGKLPTVGVEFMNRFQAILIAFEPGSEGQKLLHAETLRAYNQLIQARRLRLDAVDTGLPGVMWVVIIAGAFIGLSASFFFKVEDARLQGIHVLLLAAFIGLVIFMVFALDRPFRGDLALGPAPYQLIYDQLMKNGP